MYKEHLIVTRIVLLSLVVYRPDLQNEIFLIDKEIKRWLNSC